MRLIRGRRGWWCVAPSGVALLPDGSVERGRLSPTGLRALRAAGITTPKPIASYALTVLTSTGCNLGCPYCFQNTDSARTGHFDAPRIPAATLRLHTIRPIVDFARKRMAAAGMSALHVVLLGGEPLLNPTGCRELLRGCGDAGAVTAEMISNGTLMHPRHLASLCAYGLRSVQITLDGPRLFHDTVRTTRSGRNTFDRILNNVAAAQEATDLRFTVRVNLTETVLPHLRELIEDAARRVAAGRCLLQIAPVLNLGRSPGTALMLTSETAAQVVAGYSHGRALGFRTPLPRYGHCAFCTEHDGRTGAVVNADGTLFSCWESAGRPGYAVGTVETGYGVYPDERWVRCTSPYRGRGKRFADIVDAGLLDLAWEARKG